jgi:adenosylcobyric acid synthase
VECVRETRPEGCQAQNVWGTYLHGLFESCAIRAELASRAGFSDYRSAAIRWREHLQGVYDGMADLLEEHLNLEGIWDYVAS